MPVTRRGLEACAPPLALELALEGQLTHSHGLESLRFRGAEPGNFVRLQEDYALRSENALTLVDNYRSTGNILTVADTFLGECAGREVKTLTLSLTLTLTLTPTLTRTLTLTLR